MTSTDIIKIQMQNGRLITLKTFNGHLEYFVNQIVYIICQMQLRTQTSMNGAGLHS